MAKSLKKTSKETKKASMMRTPDFHVIYTMGAVGGFTPYDFRMNLYNESIPQPDGKITLISPAQIAMSHVAAKEFALWLSNQIKEYEGKVAKIEKPKISKLTEEERAEKP